MLPFVYLLFCLMVGILGRRHIGGFLTWFGLSLLVTPIVTLLALILLSPPPPPPPWRMARD